MKVKIATWSKCIIVLQTKRVQSEVSGAYTEKLQKCLFHNLSLLSFFLPTARYPLIKNCFHNKQLEKHLLEDTPLVKENKKREGEKKRLEGFEEMTSWLRGGEP